MNLTASSPLGGQSASPPPEGEGGRILQPRATRTTTVILVSRLVTEQGDFLCRVQNISSGGARVNSAVPLRLGQKISIELKNGQTLAGEVRWSNSPCSGVQFDAPIEVEAVLSPLNRRTKRRTWAARAPRFSAASVVLVREGGRNRPGIMLNVSQTGAKLKLSGGLPIGCQLMLTIPGLPQLRAAVRWCEEDEAGVSLLDPLSYDELSLWLRDSPVRYS